MGVCDNNAKDHARGYFNEENRPTCRLLRKGLCIIMIENEIDELGFMATVLMQSRQGKVGEIWSRLQWYIMQDKHLRYVSSEDRFLRPEIMVESVLLKAGVVVTLAMCVRLTQPARSRILRPCFLWVIDRSSLFCEVKGSILGMQTIPNFP